jgi:hypothetical protein
MSYLAAARRPAPPAGTDSRARDDAVTLAGSLVLVAGLFADGIVHNRAQSHLESFLTGSATQRVKEEQNPCSSPS